MAGQGGVGGVTPMRGPPSPLPLDLSPLLAEGHQGDQGGQEGARGEVPAAAAATPAPPANDADALALSLGQVLQHLNQQLNKLNDRLSAVRSA